MPYLGDTKLKVSFNNITLNTDRKLISGTIETTYDPTERNVVSISEGLDDIINSVKTITAIIDTAINTGSITPKDYATLEAEDDNFTKEIEDHLSYLSSILSDEEITNYRAELEKIEEYLTTIIFLMEFLYHIIMTQHFYRALLMVQ